MHPQIYKPLDKLTLLTGIRPKVNSVKSKFPDGQTGGLIISADFELAWAFRYSKTVSNPIDMAQQARSNFPELLKLFDKFEIPITWATVGHLFLEGCKKGDHDWMKRIPYFENRVWKYDTGDWFDHDPYSSYSENPAWYAPDLIENILKAKVNHEIGCHTFSHIDFTDKNCPENVARQEIEACIEAAKPWNITFKSFVFPGGTYGNIKALKENGFKVYRRVLPERLSGIYQDDFGLNVTNSTQMIGLSYKGQSIQNSVWRIKQMINKAIRTNTIAHIWFHPSDTSALVAFKSILPFITKKSENGNLWIGRMEDTIHLKDKI